MADARDPVVLHGPPMSSSSGGGRGVGGAASYPLGWYADPTGRFDRRYFDGFGWTEHVTRAGAPAVDPV